MGVVNHILDRKGSQFYDFNEQISFTRQFLCGKNSQKAIENIHKVMTLCTNLHSWDVEGLDSNSILIHKLKIN